MAAKVKKAKDPRRVTDDPLYEKKVIELARMLHEAGRGAVLKGQVLVKPTGAEGQPAVGVFVEWEDLPMPAIEGRMTMAKYLLDGRRKARMRELTK